MKPVLLQPDPVMQVQPVTGVKFLFAQAAISQHGQRQNACTGLRAVPRISSHLGGLPGSGQDQSKISLSHDFCLRG